MNALIKRDDRRGLSIVRAVAARDTASGHAPEPVPVSAEDERASQLEAALRAARDELAALREEHEREVEAVRAAAHAEGVTAGRRASDALLAGLAMAGRELRTQASEALQGGTAMAVALARSALAQIFADRDRWPAMAGDIIDARRASIDSEMLLAIRVSAADFPEESVLEPGDASDGVVLIRDPKLESGRCLFALRLGEIEVGPAMQGQKLLAFLDGHLAGGGRG